MVQEELLVRLRSEEYLAPVLPPADFLPAAERFGLVGEIDRYMVHRGIELAAGGRAVEINLSGQSIGDQCADQADRARARATGAEPSRVVFEITETAAVRDIDAARAFSTRIARLGCRCALDDFGTGFGSLTYLRQLAVQFLKIDISFVGGLTGIEADQQVVRSIVRLARDHGQQTVAEGVEDEATLELLRSSTWATPRASTSGARSRSRPRPGAASCSRRCAPNGEDSSHGTSSSAGTGRLKK